MDRTRPPRAGDERATLIGFLDRQRQTLELKCAGLTAAQLRAAAVPPSSLSLLGLVRHCAAAEQVWFQFALLGETPAPVWGRPGMKVGFSPDYLDAGFDVADADPADSFAVWREQCDRSRAILAAGPSLDMRALETTSTGFSLRHILCHMIEEYARHNGHADLLRERIDGSTGE